MKNKLFFILTVLLTIFAFTLNTFAQDYTRWGLPEGAMARLGKGHNREIAYSSDGSKLAVASNIGVWIYDAQTGEELDLYTGHIGIVVSVSFSPDGQTIASGSHDNTVRLWDVEIGTDTHSLEGHTGRVSGVAFGPDGLTFASGSWDGTILLWQLTPTEQEKSVIISFQLENGKEATLYRENEDTLFCTFGFPDEAPELEHRGPILAQAKARATLWGEGIESLEALSSALADGDGTWTTWEGEQDIVADDIAKMANSRETLGFIHVDAMTGLVSQSVYIFRTGGWEYAVSFTEARPISVPEDELDDYKSYSLTALSPDGKMLRLHSATNVTDSISPATVPSPANGKPDTPSPLRSHVGLLGARINEASTDIQDGIGVEGGVSYDFNRFAVIADYRAAISFKGFENETEAETDAAFSPLWIFQSGSLGARVYLIQKGFSPYIGGGVSVIWMSRRLLLVEENKLGPGIYGVIGIDTGRFSKSGLKLELRIDKPFSTFEHETSGLDELIDLEWDQKNFTPISLGIFYSKPF